MTIHQPDDREDMLTIILPRGKHLCVRFANTDGEFIIDYNDESVTVTADMEDSSGRVGEIYRETWGEADSQIRMADDEDCEDDE